MEPCLSCMCPDSNVLWSRLETTFNSSTCRLTNTSLLCAGVGLSQNPLVARDPKLQVALKFPSSLGNKKDHFSKGDIRRDGNASFQKMVLVEFLVLPLCYNVTYNGFKLNKHFSYFQIYLKSN